MQQLFDLGSKIIKEEENLNFQKLKLRKSMLFIGGLSTLMVQDASAIEGENWWVGGRVKQGFSVAYDLPDQAEKVGPANFLAEISGNYSPTDTLFFTGRFWLRGDWYPDIGDDIIQGGIQDFTSPGFADQFGFNIRQNTVAGFSSLPVPFGADAGGIRYLSNFNDDIIRNLSVRYVDPERRFSVRIGKFQRGWGQSDGIRLLDVLNAQDLRERFILRDTEDTRIPAWTVAVDLKLWKMGLDEAFETIGMQRASLELLFIPEVNHSQFIFNNPTPSDRTSGGLFGFPFPVLRDPKAGLGQPFLGANLTDRTPDRFSFNDAEFGARLSFEALDAQWTINGFYGQQDLPVVEFTGFDLLIGTAFNDPAQAVAVVPLGLADAIAGNHAPDQYFDFLRSLSTAPGSVAFPLVAFGCADILTGALPDCSINLNFDLNYDYRQKVIGFSMTRDIKEIRLGRKDISPVLRVEMSYEFDKPFNSNLVATPFGELESGSPGGVTDPALGIVKRDVWSTMVGLDYFLWIPGWDNQRKSIFTSIQFFNIYTEGADHLLTQAPYAFSTVRRNQNFATFLWNAEFMNERLRLEGLTIWDIDKHGFIHRQRIDFNFFGDTYRPRLEWISASGDKESVPAGIINHSDIIELSLTIQF